MFIGWSSTTLGFCSDMKFKMAATAGLSLTLDRSFLGSLVSIFQVVSEKKRFETFFP
jgi:hypothetical protein